MIFSNGIKLISILPKICTAQGTDIERVTTYKYLGFIIDQNLSFKSQTENVVSKQNIKFCFFNREKSCVSFQTRTYLISATFLPVLDYGDLLYMNASDQCLKSLDIVYHCALRFVTGCGYRVHHCTLYAAANWPSLSADRLSHWLGFIYKSLLGLVPSYICTYMRTKQILSIWPALARF